MDAQKEEVVFSEVIDICEVERTSDVFSNGSFKSLLLAQSTLDNLQKHGFKKPSPVQMKAIPPGMAGLDMLVQAKSGTGKTLVFAILAVENVKLSSKAVQKLVIAPTREIAIQIGDTIKKLAPKGTRIAVFTGGTSVYEDKNKLKNGIHIVVGTTGRLCQLVNEDLLNLGSLDLFVLDEADKMMSSAFDKDVNFLYSCVGSMRQVAVFSATYPPNLAKSLTPFLRSPIHIRLNSNDVQLVGVKQYVSMINESDALDAAITAFTSIHFKQAFLFCNKSEECPVIVERLMKKGIEGAAISAMLDQSQREDAIKRFKSNKIKVLVSTDLTSRGVDVENVDLVINLDVPVDVETYFHRIGRAARYGGQGASLTILHSKNLSRFAFLVRNGGIRAKILCMDLISPTLTTDRTFFDTCPPFVSDAFNERKGNGGKKRDDGNTQDHINAISNGVVNEVVLPDQEYSNLLDTAINLSSSLKKTETMGESKEEIIDGEKKKFKFIPSRAKKSTKYYMRGEMISMRDSFTSDQWNQYAKGRFDVMKEPFIMDESGKKDNDKDENRQKRESAIHVRINNSSDASHNIIKEYTRKDLISICKSKPSKVWRIYAESKWNLSDDPFVMDQSMRCSFTQRIQLQRRKEKAERDNVVAERAASRLRIISIGTKVSPLNEWNGSFQDYCMQMKKEKEMERNKGGQGKGGVINRRRGHDEYRKKVEETNRIMEMIEKNYESSYSMALKVMSEVKEEEKEEEEELEEKELAIQEYSEDTMDKEDNERDEVKLEYHDDEVDGEGKEENGERGEYEWKNEEDGDYDNNVLEAHSRLYYSYNRNIEFARVFNAYLSMSNVR